MTESEQIIQQCKSIAEQHYPDEVHAALAYQKFYATLLETKIRELLYRAPALQVLSEPPRMAIEAMDRVGQVVEFPGASRV